VVLDNAEIEREKATHSITREERQCLVETLKDLKLNVSGTRPLSEAIVTAGGVATNEINPRTMESKIISGLYFAGEIIDIDGNTGGFNLQAAFSTGYVAGANAADK
jgi:predicted Rossmann fold flavoprotein